MDKWVRLVQRLVTVFWDLTVEDELKLRDWFGKTFVPTLNVNKPVVDVKFEFITGGLLFGKVLGKKAYKVTVPPELHNTVLGSTLRTDRVIVNGREYRVEWHEFYFANPDKITVKIRDLRRRQRKGWKGKAFKSVFWSWDGGVTLRVIVKTVDGKVGYYDILRIIFVYKGNKSEDLTTGARQLARISKEKERIREYLATVYPFAANILDELFEVIESGKKEERQKLISDLFNRLAEALRKEFGGRWRQAYKYILAHVSRYIQLKYMEVEYAKLTNRNTGARFLVLADYYRVYNPLGDGFKPLRFYAEQRAKHVEKDDRWADEFGNQFFVLLNVRKDEDVMAKVGELLYAAKDIEITKVIAKDVEAEKKFTPAGLRGFLNHELRFTGVPPKDITVERAVDAEIDRLRRIVRVPKPRVVVTAAMGERTELVKPVPDEVYVKLGWIRSLLLNEPEPVRRKYIIYIVRPVDHDVRLLVHNRDHRHEGKDRIVVHVRHDQILVFVHKL